MEDTRACSTHSTSARAARIQQAHEDIYNPAGLLEDGDAEADAVAQGNDQDEDDNRDHQ